MVEFAELQMKDGKLVKTNVRHIPQSLLTTDCWLVQFQGLKACTTCELKDTPNCGGNKALKKAQIIAELKGESNE